MEKKSPIALREEKTLAFWRENKIFEKTLEKESPKGEFVFYDGPPFATGTPHYGHLLAGTMKDVIPRFKTMQGFHVPRRWGWDCHGLPIENLVEKELNLKSKKDIEDFGIEKFNEAAREAVLRYDHEWKEIVPRTGRFIDMDHAYVTMDPTYSESIWWSFKTLYDKNLIYQGFKSMFLCPHCETTLSNFEVSQGYKDITDISVYVKFELENNSPSTGSGHAKTFVLAWTTTPWTLPGNVALAVNPEILYVLVEVKGEKVILAKERLAALKDEHLVIKEFKGSELIGKKYQPLFDYYQNADLKNKENIWKIVGADFVTTTDGTGVVHIAPAFGEDDYNLSLKENLPFIQHVSVDGKFKKEVTDFAGQPVKPISTKDEPQAHQKADIEIIKYLAGKGTLFAKEKIIHSYPHCWRCDTPLLNYASSSWFVKVTDLKDKLVSENGKVHWVPEEIGTGRFGKWLENARDWAISRSRFWGAPLPVWICKKCEKIEVIGSVEELKQKTGGIIPKNKKGELDLHRPYIDGVNWPCSCGGEMKRVPEVFDTWYESGSMPYSQIHYPFENKELIDQRKFFPADFIAEGQDQTRGWFYSLLVLSTGLFGESPYKNVIANGIVLAEDGQKMAKRLKNYPEVTYILDRYGADAMRYYLLSSPVVHAEDLAFSEKGLDEVVKKIIMRLDNVFTFYATYAGENTEAARSDSNNILDKWIIARLNELGNVVTESLERYELDRAAKPFMQFVDDLSTWYLRRSRNRFKDEDIDDKKNALATMRYVLLELSKLMAPFMPFMAEDLFQKLNVKAEVSRATAATRHEAREAQAALSVHLETWPHYAEASRGTSDILAEMSEVRKIVSLALEARAKAGIKVRQPLRELKIKNEELSKNQDLIELIKDEVNVKSVTFDLKLEGEVFLDITMTDDLKREGQARDLIRAIQELRKAAKLNPHDIVKLAVSTDEIGKSLISEFESDIKKTALISDISFSETEGEKIEVDELTFTISLLTK